MRRCFTWRAWRVEEVNLNQHESEQLQGQGLMPLHSLEIEAISSGIRKKDMASSLSFKVASLCRGSGC
jgi:hypothetical protein